MILYNKPWYRSDLETKAAPSTLVGKVLCSQSREKDREIKRMSKNDTGRKDRGRETLSNSVGERDRESHAVVCNPPAWNTIILSSFPISSRHERKTLGWAKTFSAEAIGGEKKQLSNLFDKASGTQSCQLLQRTGKSPSYPQPTLARQLTFHWPLQNWDLKFIYDSYIFEVWETKSFFN